MGVVWESIDVEQPSYNLSGSNWLVEKIVCLFEILDAAKNLIWQFIREEVPDFVTLFLVPFAYEIFSNFQIFSYADISFIIDDLDKNTQIYFSFEINFEIDDIETRHVLLRAIFIPEVTRSHTDFERKADGHLSVRKDKLSEFLGSLYE